MVVVFSSSMGSLGQGEEDLMEMMMSPPLVQRSNPLHNFNLPYLKWGSRKVMRCLKVNSNNSNDVVSAADFVHRKSPEQNLIENFKDSELGSSTDRRRVSFKLKALETVLEKDPILRQGLKEKEEAKPWNLRSRSAACNGGGVEVVKPNYSPLRKDVGAKSNCGEKRERAKFSVSLNRQKIEEDFRAITGHRLPRRPKKRPKNVQKTLDTLFPGLWLTEINADSYKVPDDA